jgi:photosystem II stability/assembly factor-like uncharacterized protein
MRLISAVTLMAAALGGGPVSAGPNFWTSLGPDGGQISSVVIHPQDSDTLYAATNAGIFKSTDGTTTWSPANSGLSTFLVRRPVIDPQTPNTLYAATDGGIYRSTDAGASWNPVNPVCRFLQQEL